MSRAAEAQAATLAETQERLTIFDLRDSPWVDGPGRTILEIAEALNRSGFRYIIGALVREGERNDYVEEARQRGLEVVAIVERSPFDREVLAQVALALERFHVDVMHTHEARSDVIGLLCTRSKRVRLLTTTHGWIANNWKGHVYSVLDKVILRWFDRVVVVSERMKGQLRRWAVPGGKIEVVPNALMVDEYCPDRSEDGFRRELGLRPENVLIAYIGRLSPEKGPDVFLRAAAQVCAEYPSARFVLIGVGPEELALRALASSLGIADSVIFAGYRKDMKRIYNSLDLVVQSSYTEGMPNVVLEALLMQVPVIATNVGGTAEVMQHERHGILVPAGSPDRLAVEIKQFMRGPNRLAAMARAGRERIREVFDSRKRIERMKQIYRAVCTEA